MTTKRNMLSDYEMQEMQSVFAARGFYVCDDILNGGRPVTEHYAFLGRPEVTENMIVEMFRESAKFFYEKNPDVFNKLREVEQFDETDPEKVFELLLGADAKGCAQRILIDEHPLDAFRSFAALTNIYGGIYCFTLKEGVQDSDTFAKVKRALDLQNPSLASKIGYEYKNPKERRQLEERFNLSDDELAPEFEQNFSRFSPVYQQKIQEVFGDNPTTKDKADFVRGMIGKVLDNEQQQGSFSFGVNDMDDVLSKLGRQSPKIPGIDNLQTSRNSFSGIDDIVGGSKKSKREDFFSFTDPNIPKKDLTIDDF